MTFLAVMLLLFWRGVSVLILMLSESHTVEADACTEGDVAVPSAASLLQRELGHIQRQRLLQEIDNEAKDCSCGSVTQGTCWCLSELAESCGHTCTRNKRDFSFVVAKNVSLVMPSLVGDNTLSKQDPWLAFECYVPSADRYHLANANAANFQNDLDSLSHQDCRLACPCGHVSSEARLLSAASSPSTRSKQVPVLGPVPDNIPILGPVPDNCEWLPAAGCEKEFEYEGTRYTGCTRAYSDTLGNTTTPWCSQTDPYNGLWSTCVSNCSSVNGTDRVVDSTAFS